jgi:hypothetical protein
MSLVNQPDPASTTAEESGAATGFLSAQPARRQPESALARLVATAGIVGIGTAVGAILGSADVDAWLVAMVVATLSVVLAAILWRSRVL